MSKRSALDNLNNESHTVNLYAGLRWYIGMDAPTILFMSFLMRVKYKSTIFFGVFGKYLWPVFGFKLASSFYATVLSGFIIEGLSSLLFPL